MTIHLPCPECDRWTLTDQVSAAAWTCAACGGLIPARGHAGEESDSPPLACCRVCGNHELYLQKDFPHWLGMGILAAACLVSALTYAFYWIKTTWAILIGSALVDGILYLVMGNVAVCYRCQAQYRGFLPADELKPFDLAVAEKYRQERLRRQEKR